MSKYKTVMQRNKRAAYVLGLTVTEYFETVALPKAQAKWAKRGYMLEATEK